MKVFRGLLFLLFFIVANGGTFALEGIQSGAEPDVATAPSSENQSGEIQENEVEDEEKEIRIRKVIFEDDEGRIVDVSSVDEKMFHLLRGQDYLVLDTEKLLDDLQLLRDEFPQYAKVILKADPIDKDSEEAAGETAVETSEEEVEEIHLRFIFQIKRIVRYLNIVIPDEVETPEGLRDQLKIAIGEQLDGNLVEKDKELIRKKLLVMGYPKALVQSEVNNLNSDNEVEVLYQIVLNTPKVYIDTIGFTGNSSVDKDELEDIMELKKYKFWIFKKNILDMTIVAADEERIRTFYLSRGFMDMEIEVQISGEEEGEAHVQFVINEGPQYDVLVLKLEGVEKFSEEEIRPLIQIEEGRPYSGEKLQQSIQGIREYYGTRGFAMARVGFEFDSETKTLQLTINEGQKHYIDSIRIEGNQNMSQEVILNDVLFFPGEPVDTQKITDTVEKLRRTKFYQDVKIDYHPQTENSGVVIIQISEAQDQFIEFGASVSGNPHGYLGYSNTNLLWTGKGLYLNAEKNDEITKLSLIFNDPHFLGTDFQLKTEVHYNDEELEHFEQQKVGGAIIVSRLIRHNLKIGLGTRIDFVDIQNASVQLENEEGDVEGTDHIAGLIGTLVYNKEKQDENGEAHEGFKIKMSIYPSFTDREVYLKGLAEAIGHVTLHENSEGQKHILTGRVTLGYASENTPFYERYYGGGNRMIKGYKSKSISPEGQVAGGNILLSGGGYYSFPVYKKILKGVLFVEAASVGEDISDIGDVRVVGGAGVRANLRRTFLGNSIEGGFLVPALDKEGDEFRPFYFLFGNYDPGYSL